MIQLTLERFFRRSEVDLASDPAPHHCPCGGYAIIRELVPTMCVREMSRPLDGLLAIMGDCRPQAAGRGVVVDTRGAAAPWAAASQYERTAPTRSTECAAVQSRRDDRRSLKREPFRRTALRVPLSRREAAATTISEMSANTPTLRDSQNIDQLYAFGRPEG